MNLKFDFNNPTRILFGSGALNELGSQRMPGKKALLLMSGGKSARVSGAYARTLEQLARAGVEAVEFAKVIFFSSGMIEYTTSMPVCSVKVWAVSSRSASTYWEGLLIHTVRAPSEFLTSTASFITGEKE